MLHGGEKRAGRASARVAEQRGWGSAAGEMAGPTHPEPGLGRCGVAGRESKPIEIKMTSPALWRELQKISQNK